MSFHPDYDRVKYCISANTDCRGAPKWWLYHSMWLQCGRCGIPGSRYLVIMFHKSGYYGILAWSLVTIGCHYVPEGC